MLVRIGKVIRWGFIQILLLPLWIYRNLISPLTPPTCRYEPTCSKYAVDAIKIHGPIKGLILAIKRISRCNPFGGCGYDPVPEKNEGKNVET